MRSTVFLPRGDNGYFMGQHQIQLVEQALMLMSQLDPGNQVFLIGTTNHIDHIDPRVLRGGRFTEKIEVGIPDDQGYLRLIEKYLGPIPLAASLTCHDLLARLRGISPADLQGLVNTAKRMAMNRMTPTTKPCRRSSGRISSMPLNELELEPERRNPRRSKRVSAIVGSSSSKDCRIPTENLP